MSADVPPGTTKAKLTFVLIHGTFARAAEWVSSDAAGSFRDQLRRAFSTDYDVVFDVVDWGETGRLQRLLRDNTLKRRFAGAAKLAQHLRECADVSDAERRYLVAHSHGGSVVMYALNNADILNKVSGVICLSSPFLHYRYVPFHRDLLFFSALVLIFVAADAGNVLLWMYAAIYAAVAGTVLFTQNFGHSVESVSKLVAQRLRVKIPERAELANASGPIPFLAVRPHRDEVTGLFWFTQNAGRGFRALWQFVNTVGRWALYGFFAVRIIEWAIEELAPEFDLTALDNAMSLIDRHFMTPVMLVATAVLLGMVVMRLSYALDALPWLARLDLRAKILPWDGADAVAVDTFGMMAHTSVQLPAPPKIIDWIRRGHRVDAKDRIASEAVPHDEAASSLELDDRATEAGQHRD